MDKDLQKAGAIARAYGRDQFNNPYLKSENMPANTGDPIDVWQAKHDAWHLGWTMEDAMRA